MGKYIQTPNHSLIFNTIPWNVTMKYFQLGEHRWICTTTTRTKRARWPLKPVFKVAQTGKQIEFTAEGLMKCWITTRQDTRATILSPSSKVVAQNWSAKAVNSDHTSFTDRRCHGRHFNIWEWQQAKNKFIYRNKTTQQMLTCISKLDNPIRHPSYLTYLPKDMLVWLSNWSWTSFVCLREIPNRSFKEYLKLKQFVMKLISWFKRMRWFLSSDIRKSSSAVGNFGGHLSSFNRPNN